MVQASQQAPAQTATSPQPSKAGMQVTNVAGQPGGNKKLWLWIIIAVIVVGAGIAAYFLI